MDVADLPCGDLKLRTMTMPGDLNAVGTIFGGWIMARMDQAAGMAASARARGLTTVAAVKELRMLRPLRPGQEIEIFAELVKTGRTSMQFALQLWACDHGNAPRQLCADALFVMVAVDETGRPRPLPEG